MSDTPINEILSNAVTDFRLSRDDETVQVTVSFLRRVNEKIEELQLKIEVAEGNYEGIKETQLGIIKQRDYWEERCRAAEAERDALLQKLDSYSYALEQVEQANEALRQASEGQRQITEAAQDGKAGE